MRNNFGPRQKKNNLDKFYTKPEVSKRLLTKLFSLYDEKNFDVFLEPSAGNGSFYLNLPQGKTVGLDIEPDCEGVVRQDFFNFKPENNKIYAVVGNPPFGRVSSLAIKFFEKSAEFADIIAFIVPRTFKRVSVQNRLNLNFHLAYEEDLPINPCSFEPKMSAKCCFQVWEKKQIKRKKVFLPKEHKDWQFLALGPKDSNGQPTPPDGADFALKAYGANCGQIVTEGLEKLRPKSWHWIKTQDPVELIKVFKKLDYSISKDTARQDSIGRAELVQLYTQNKGG